MYTHNHIYIYGLVQLIHGPVLKPLKPCPDHLSTDPDQNVQFGLVQTNSAVRFRCSPNHHCPNQHPPLYFSLFQIHLITRFLHYSLRTSFDVPNCPISICSMYSFICSKKSYTRHIHKSREYSKHWNQVKVYIAIWVIDGSLVAGSRKTETVCPDHLTQGNDRHKQNLIIAIAPLHICIKVIL